MSICKHESCSKRSVFNLPGKIGGLFCATHKLNDMVNVINKTCLYESCRTRPLYNVAGSKTGIYCNVHKLPGMIDVKNKRCKFDGCSISSAYNFPSEKRGIYCFEHKLAGMENVVSRKCEFVNCNIIAQYNVPGCLGGSFCSIHKLPDMIDIKHKKCKFDGCQTIPTYKYQTDTQPQYCTEHKLPDMIDGKHNKCLYENCNIRPSYNYYDKKELLYCFEHKLPDMVDKKHATCLSEWCTTRPGTRYEGYCLFCYINLFPDKPISRNYKTKEYAVVEFVKKTFPDLSWIADSRISDGCSRRRPDILLDLGNQIIIVEIDENQHTLYDCSCENKRLMEISQDVGHRPIVFIRFNPDQYIDKNGKKIKSCWSFSSNGLLSIPILKKTEWLNRLASLQQQIDYWLHNTTDKTIETVQLFYDGL